jgi:hypothetical protein
MVEKQACPCVGKLLAFSVFLTDFPATFEFPLAQLVLQMPAYPKPVKARSPYSFRDFLKNSRARPIKQLYEEPHELKPCRSRHES